MVIFKINKKVIIKSSKNLKGYPKLSFSYNVNKKSRNHLLDSLIDRNYHYPYVYCILLCIDHVLVEMNIAYDTSSVTLTLHS